MRANEKTPAGVFAGVFRFKERRNNMKYGTQSPIKVADYTL